MATLTIQDLEHHAGQDLGTSSWHVVTQERVDLFAVATGDHQWIHVDRQIVFYALPANEKVGSQP